MTTIQTVEIRCGICGNPSESIRITSTSSFGSPDLDSRPDGPARSTNEYGVQRCPSCGYCSEDISSASDGTREIIESSTYIEQLNHPDYPALANNYLCMAMINEQKSDFADAGWAGVRAAWACDDKGNEGAARSSRLLSVKWFNQARIERAQIATPAEAASVLVSDLLRRAGDFEAAAQVCHEGLDGEPDSFVATLLRFQLRLIERRDARLYTIEEGTSQELPEMPRRVREQEARSRKAQEMLDQFRRTREPND